ncbi:MAG: hypothetical protein ACLQBJ_12215 [Bryobacteraceae bacterium]
MMKFANIITAVFVPLSIISLLSCSSTRPAPPQTAATVNKRVLGVSPWSNPNYQMIKDAGIGWVRLGFEFPFEDKIGGKLSDKFLKNLDEARKVKTFGLRIMGVTPLAGIMAYEEKDKKTAWRPHIPAWAGSIDSDIYYDTYEKGCEELGRQTKGLVDMWQVSNEMDIDVFRGPLSVEQAERFMLAGARGLKKGNPEAKADINPAGLEGGERIFRDIYSKPDNPFDYAGIDGYFGSWSPGGPQDWIPVIEKIHGITGKPVLINEWGYSSIEGSGKPLNRKVGNPVCEKQKWNNVWGEGHTPEGQAAYAAIALKIFGTYPDVVGCFFYDWGDDAVCYHCGRKNCPGECGWGMTDPQGKPKPAYGVFKTLAPQYF